MHTHTYTLSDLAKMTGLEPRTIRSYIERDLLPGASSKGRGASYSDDHLHRLGAINKLRSFKSDISLKQLRVLLQQLRPEQIQGIAEGTISIAGLVDTDTPAEEGSALDYLRAVHWRDSGASRHGLHRTPPRSPADPANMTSVEQLLEALVALAGSQRVPHRVRDEIWHRLPITRDIELSVRGPYDPEQLAQLRQIADHLRHFLTRGVHS